MCAWDLYGDIAILALGVPPPSISRADATDGGFQDVQGLMSSIF